MIYPNLNKATIAIIGLGYVGLPLAIEIYRKNGTHFKKQPLKRKVIGFDINQERLNQLCDGYDSTGEFSQRELKEVNGLVLTSNLNLLSKSDIFIVSVPTPIDKYKNLLWGLSRCCVVLYKRVICCCRYIINF